MKHSGLVERTRAILFSTARRFGLIGDAFFPENLSASAGAVVVCQAGLIFPAGRDALCVKGRGRARSVFPYPNDKLPRIARISRISSGCSATAQHKRLNNSAYRTGVAIPFG